VEAWPPPEGRWEAGRIREIISSHGRLQLQPASCQGKLKISYRTDDLDGPCLDELREDLSAAEQAVEIVRGAGGDLSFLPDGVSVGSAADFLVSQWRLHPSQAIVAGGTVGDLSMFGRGFVGVTVANAPAELRQLEDPRVYHSSLAHADGVVDGARYWLARTAAG
jgi:hydroxymethylpyrimidine pyrophosphatase-like HAD family hydrolase